MGPDFRFHLWNTYIGFSVANFLNRLLGQNRVSALDLIQFVLRKFLDVQDGVVAAFGGAEQFIQFDLDGFAVAVLSVLNQKHHQECDDRRGRIDYKLPGIAEMKNWSQNAPYHNGAERTPECHWPADDSSRHSGEPLKPSVFFPWLAMSIVWRQWLHNSGGLTAWLGELE